MRDRNRLLAGLFALLAMTLLLAEGVLASTCSLHLEAGRATDHAAHATHGAAGHDGGTHSDAPVSKTGDCPFAPLGAAGGCTGAAVVIAESGSPRVALPDERDDDARAADSEPSSHTGASLFHPPRR